MKRATATFVMAVVLLSLWSCQKMGTTSDETEIGETSTALRMASMVDENSDVTGVEYTVTSCDDPNNVTVIARPLEDQILPGNIPELKNKPLDEDSEHMFTDLFLVLEPGCYNVYAQPITETGGDSEICAAAWMNGVEVFEAQVTEIFLMIQCAGDDMGGIDIIAALNHEPSLTDVVFTDSKFVCGTTEEICLYGSDVDNDPLEFELTADEGCEVVGPEPLLDGEACFQVTCNKLGRVDLVGRVYDLAWKEDGTQVRIETWLAEAGYPNESHGELNFYMYLDGIKSYPDTDGDGFGDSEAEATLDCTGEDIPEGHVTDNSDCDDTDPSIHPDAPEICNDGMDNDCDGEIDENACLGGEGHSGNGLLLPIWTHPLYENNGYYDWGNFGSSPGIADFGLDVGDGDERLEIVTGSDAFSYVESDLGSHVPGAWHMFNHDGATIWAKNTPSDEARGDVAIADLNGDGFFEIAGGTTSGATLEIMDRHGSFVWTFPDPPISGASMWPGGPAVDEVDIAVDGLEVLAGNRFENTLYAFDGDNTDGIDEGISKSGWSGVEGMDWDVLWTHSFGSGLIFATPAIGDIDDDGDKEVVLGSTNGQLAALDAQSGAVEWTLVPGGAIYSSAALVDMDGDGDLEIIVGTNGAEVFFIDGDEDSSGAIEADEYTSVSTGGPVYSSPAVGDVDNDGDLEVIIGCHDGQLRSFDYDPGTNSAALNWSTALGGELYSSPSLADRQACDPYRIDWAMFRHDSRRTGFYGPTTATLDVYIGSTDGYLYLVDGTSGSIIDQFFTGYYQTGTNEIRTSPSVADVDGDGKLEIFFYEWGTEDTFWALRDMGSCP